MSWKITKDFEFDYGHRVWSQQLNAEYSVDTCLACRHIHGHRGRIQVTLGAEDLQNGMVTDFKHLNWFKKWLDDTLDHKFIMDVSDPALPMLFPRAISRKYWDTWEEGHATLYKQQYLGMETFEKEIYEGLVIVPFVPTSENLSAWIFKIIEQKMKQIGVTVSSVTLYETPKSCSEYTR